MLGVASWGVIKGRQRLARPSQKEIRERIRDQIKDRNDRAPVDSVKNVGTEDMVLKDYARYKAKSWADPQSLPVDVGERVTFCAEGSSDEGGSALLTLDEIGLTSHEGRPNITLKYPYLRTGKIGRGILGRWGPNHAIDTIVTRRIPAKDGKKGKADREKALAGGEQNEQNARMTSSGLQVALVFRPTDQLWAIPGKFMQYEDIMIMSRVDQGQRLSGELPSLESDNDLDRARLAVRKVFELGGIPEARQEEYTDMFDEIFKKSAQTLVYRGYSDDPRNTNEAWVETSAWHVHCPVELCDQLERGYEEQGSEQVMWMDIVVTGPRLEFQDEFGNKYDLFASHRELIELAVFGNVLGNHDMPFEYDGINREKDRSEIVALNPNHSHYLCVDNGEVGRFGVELNFRVELETFMSCFDHNARRMGIAELTQHFTACMDESSLHVASELAVSGKKSHVIELEAEMMPNVIPIVRTASDGKTRVTYTMKVHKGDGHNPVSPNRSTSDKSEVVEDGVEDPDLPSQFSLEGLDVTELKLSDGDLDFFPDTPFDPYETEYDVTVPKSVKSVTVTASLEAAHRKDIKRTVPIVMLCYGGGPFTIHTLASSGEKPIIIVSGSLRAAQYIEDWCKMETQKAAKRNDPQAVERLDMLQKQQARKSLRMDFAGANKTTFEAVEEHAVKPQWWNVESFIVALTKLGQHAYMHFFDISQTATVKTNKKIRLNPMLPPLLDSIVKSAQVKQDVKLPLAIRLNHEDDVKTLCDAHGIALANAKQEISFDSRLLVFAAFNDQGKVVERLLDTGFKIHNLDVLIALEIQRELDRPKLVKEDEPPAYWVAKQFQAGQYSSPAELAQLVATRWRKVESKETVYRAISWNMMPSLPGWLMMVESCAPEHWWPPAMLMQQLSAKFIADEYPPAGLMRRKFIVISPPQYAGQQFVAEDEAPEDGGLFSCVVRFVGKGNL